MNARVLLYDHDARIEVTDMVYNEPRTASRGPTHRSRRRRTTADDDAPRSSALILRDACRTRDDRSIDRARRLDATRRDATRIAHREGNSRIRRLRRLPTRGESNRARRARRDATGRSRGIARPRDDRRRRTGARAIDRDGTRGRARDGTRRDDDDARRRDATTGRDASDASDASDAKGASDERRWGS